MDQEAELIEKAKEGMDDEEAQFSVQHELEKQSFLWSDKYRPRKPRFFNRVHTVRSILLYLVLKYLISTLTISVLLKFLHTEIFLKS